MFYGARNHFQLQILKRRRKILKYDQNESKKFIWDEWLFVNNKKGHQYQKLLALKKSDHI